MPADTPPATVCSSFSHLGGGLAAPENEAAVDRAMRLECDTLARKSFSDVAHTTSDRRLRQSPVDDVAEGVRLTALVEPEPRLAMHHEAALVSRDVTGHRLGEGASTAMLEEDGGDARYLIAGDRAREPLAAREAAVNGKADGRSIEAPEALAVGLAGAGSNAARAFNDNATARRRALARAFAWNASSNPEQTATIRRSSLSVRASATPHEVCDERFVEPTFVRTMARRSKQ